MNCSENFTPRLRLWSAVRRDVLNIEFSSRWTRRRSKLCSSPSGGISTLLRRRLATGGSNHICRRAIPHLSRPTRFTIFSLAKIRRPSNFRHDSEVAQFPLWVTSANPHAPRSVVASEEAPARKLPRAGTKPSLHHGETIAAPKRFAIDEDPGGAEKAARNRSFAMLARDGLDFGIAYAC